MTSIYLSEQSRNAEWGIENKYQNDMEYQRNQDNFYNNENHHKHQRLQFRYMNKDTNVEKNNVIAGNEKRFAFFNGDRFMNDAKLG